MVGMVMSGGLYIRDQQHGNLRIVKFETTEA